MNGPPFTNHLIQEKSPYLLQHAHNPVDWYPWGKEAFELAKAQDKPIFLSIGYATCHWCHVMESESFENVEIASLMNETFVNIKVDREELPEVDSLYMEFAQALMSSAGGWPLNVLLTPDLKPFFAVTYLPPKTQRGMLGLDQFSIDVKQLWQSGEREHLIEQAERIVEIFAQSSQALGEVMPGSDDIRKSVETLFDVADPIYGGIKGQPKFPLGYQALFLLGFARAHEDSRALFYVDLTLEMMRRGGIYDQLGGGFSRYSVDEAWIVPHFEKMAYDNAILARTYLEAWKYNQKPEFRRVAEETLQYVMRDLCHPEGGFYSAEDADSEGHEGLYYTWTPLEVQKILPQEEAALFCQYYGVEPAGNFEGRSVLHIEMPLSEFAESIGLSPDIVEKRLEKARLSLLEKRKMRPPPFKDDKIIVSWNGLMIDACIKAASSFENESWQAAAIQSAEFIKEHLWKDEHLLRRFREGEARFSAGLKDYAFLIKGLLSLFEEGCGTSYLAWAMKMTDVLEKEFKAEKGAFYETAEKETILIRKCDFYDGSEPSGNGVHAENLLRLYQMTQDAKYLTQAEDILKAAEMLIQTYPPGACYTLMALQRYLDKKAATLVIALDDQESLKKEIKRLLSSQFHPHLVTIWKKNEDHEINALLPSLKERGPVDGQTAVYLCYQDSCRPPLVMQEEIYKTLQSL